MCDLIQLHLLQMQQANLRKGEAVPPNYLHYEQHTQENHWWLIWGSNPS